MLPETRYVTIDALLSRDVCTLLRDYIRLRHEAKTMSTGDSRIAGAPSMYCDTLTETLLSQHTAYIEGIIGSPLWPTFSYARMHSTGAQMAMHTDREAGEIGVSISIGGDVDWPLWLRTAQGDVPIAQKPGDAVVYRGREVPHWREPFLGTEHMQCMLFYVLQDGPCASWKYDRRPHVGWRPQNLEQGEEWHKRQEVRQ